LLCGNWEDAEDVVQVALTKLYRAWPNIDRRDETPDAYARAVVRNAFVDDWRRPWRKWETATAEIFDDAEALLDCVEADGTALRDALLQLPMRQRQVIVWRFYWGLSQAETAIELDITLGTVKSHTARALARLHQLLQPEVAQ